MNKLRILDLLYKEDIMRKMHESVLDSLVGCMDREYMAYFPEKPTLIIKPPIFKAVVDMLVANLIHHFVKDLIEKIVDSILKDHKENQ